MVKFNPKKAVNACNDLVSQSKYSKHSAGAIGHSREMEMIPKYLELASLKGADRFNPHEIKQITVAFGEYDTKLSKTDLLKDLLSIGSEKGSPLSAEEMKGFLKATTSMKQLEQRNVYRFLKAAKENETVKVTPSNIREVFPFEQYKQREIKRNEGTDFLKHHPDWLDEDKIKERYENAVSNEIRILTNKYYAPVLDSTYTPAKYITQNSRDVVKAAANAVDPERFATVVQYTGTSPNVLAAANDLTYVLKLSNDRPELMIDLAKAFYPHEIKQIVKHIGSVPKENLTYYASYTINNTQTTAGALNEIRKFVLEDLGLTDKVTLKTIKPEQSEDVYGDSIFAMRGSKISKGNFERGKKK